MTVGDLRSLVERVGEAAAAEELGAKASAVRKALRMWTDDEPLRGAIGAAWLARFGAEPSDVRSIDEPGPPIGAAGAEETKLSRAQLRQDMHEDARRRLWNRHRADQEKAETLLRNHRGLVASGLARPEGYRVASSLFGGYTAGAEPRTTKEGVLYMPVVRREGLIVKMVPSLMSEGRALAEAAELARGLCRPR